MTLNRQGPRKIEWDEALDESIRQDELDRMAEERAESGRRLLVLLFGTAVLLVGAWFRFQ